VAAGAVVVVLLVVSGLEDVVDVVDRGAGVAMTTVAGSPG